MYAGFTAAENRSLGPLLGLALLLRTLGKSAHFLLSQFSLHFFWIIKWAAEGSEERGQKRSLEKSERTLCPTRESIGFISKEVSVALTLPHPPSPYRCMLTGTRTRSDTNRLSQ